MTEIKIVAAEIYPVVKGRVFHQEVGFPTTADRACCFGARLAIAFCEPRPSGRWDYSFGAEWLTRQTGLLADHVDEILYMCGSDASPFSENGWPHHPEVVMKRMWSIESPPKERARHIGATPEDQFTKHTGKTWAEAEADFDRYYIKSLEDPT